MEEDNRRKDLDDSLRDAYSTYRTARSLAGLGRTLSAARGAIAAAGVIGSGGWVALIVVGLLLVISVFTLVIVSGSPGATSEISPGEEQEITTQQIFEIEGNDPLSDAYLKELLSDALSNNKFKTLLTERGLINISINKGRADFAGCEAEVLGKTIFFYGFSKNCSKSEQKYLLLHELGHVIGNRNARLYQSFPYEDLKEAESSCFGRRGILLSYYYSDREGGGKDVFDETFAESIAQFSMYNERTRLKFFPNQCPKIYGWVKDNIF